MIAELCSRRIEWCGLDAYVALLDIITLNPYKSPAHVPRFSLGLSCAYVLVATIVPTSHGAVNGAHMSLRPIVAASIALRMYRGHERCGHAPLFFRQDIFFRVGRGV